MRRRTFLHGVVVSALAVNHARTWAQSTTPSLLGEGKPSRTAQATANLRAAHQLLHQPKIFDDPLALRIIGIQAEAAVRANLGRSPIATFRPFVAVRSRYAEDELARAVERGVRQILFLSPGGATTMRFSCCRILSAGHAGMSPARFDPDPVATKSRLPSRETARSFVQCRFVGRFPTTTSAGPRRSEVAVTIRETDNLIGRGDIDVAGSVGGWKTIP